MQVMEGKLLHSGRCWSEMNVLLEETSIFSCCLTRVLRYRTIRIVQFFPFCFKLARMFVLHTMCYNFLQVFTFTFDTLLFQYPP